MRIIVISALVLVYTAGCFRLNQAVSDACTHGNCIHGWYSKYNGAEKLAFFAWAIGFPLAVAGLRTMIRERNGDADRARLAHKAEVDAIQQRFKQRISRASSARSRKAWQCSQ